MSDQIQSPASSAPKGRRVTPQPLQALEVRDALLKLQTVQAATALSKSSIYAKMANGQFPQAVRLGARCTRWRAGDVSAWLAAQTA